MNSQPQAGNVTGCHQAACQPEDLIHTIDSFSPVVGERALRMCRQDRRQPATTLCDYLNNRGRTDTFGLSLQPLFHCADRPPRCAWRMEASVANIDDPQKQILTLFNVREVRSEANLTRGCLGLKATQ